MKYVLTNLFTPPGAWSGQVRSRFPTKKQVAGMLANFWTDGITAKVQGVTVRASHRLAPVPRQAFTALPGRQVEMAPLAPRKQPYQSRLTLENNLENNWEPRYPEEPWKAYVPWRVLGNPGKQPMLSLLTLALSPKDSIKGPSPPSIPTLLVISTLLFIPGSFCSRSRTHGVLLKRLEIS